MQASAINIKIMADIADVQQKFAAMQSAASQSASRMSSTFSGVGATIAASLAAAFSVGAMSSWVKNSINAIDAMNDISERTGLAVEQIAGLQLAFQFSGMQADALDGALGKMAKSMASGSEAFKAMGINVKSTDGSLKSSRDVLGEVADQFAGYKDGADKAALAQEIFGRAGADMIPLLNLGSQGLAEFDAMAQKLGLTMEDETAKKAALFNDTIDLMGLGMQGVGRQVAAQLLPTLSSLAGQFFNSMTEGDRLKNIANGLSVVFKSLYIVGVSVVNVFRGIGMTLAAAAAELVAFLSGDFAGAKAIDDQWIVDMKNLYSNTAQSISAAWSATGDTTIETMAAQAAAMKKNAPNVKEYKDLQEGAAKATQAANKARDEAEKKRLADEAKILQDAQKQVETLQEKAKAQEWANETYGMGKHAVEELTLAEMEQQLAMVDATKKAIPGYTEALEKRIEAQKRLIKAMKEGELIEANDKAAQKVKEEWEKTSNEINNTITDALMRGFESGAGFAKNMRDTIVNMFKSMVLRPVVNAIVNVATGAVGLSAAGGAQAAIGGGGSGGLAGNLFSLASNGSSLVSIGGSVISGTMSLANAAGTVFANAAAPIFGDGISALLATNAAYGTAGAAAAGGTAAAASTGSSLMSSLASASPYIAAALLALNALGVFKSKKIVGGGLMGTLGEGNISAYDLQRRGGSIFSGPKYSLENIRVSEQSKALQDTFTALRNSVVEAGKQLDLPTNRVAKFKTSLGRDLIHPDTGGYGLTFDGLSTEQINAKVEKALMDAQEKMAEMLVGQGGWKKVGESAVQAMTRLIGSLNQVNGVFDMLNQRLIGTGIVAADAASKLIDAAGGQEAFANLASGYYQAIYTQEEKLAESREQLLKAFQGVFGSNAQLPQTLADYKALAQAQDLMSDAGRRQYTALLALAPAFAEVHNATQAAAQAATDAAKASAEAAMQEAKAKSDALKASAKSINDWLVALNISTGTPNASMSAARSQYLSTLQLARANDESALGSITGMADQYMAAARGQVATAAQYAAVVAQISAEVGSLSAVAGYRNMTSDMLATSSVAATPYFAAAQPLNQAEVVNALTGEIRSLRAEVAGLRAEAQATAVNTGKTSRLIERVTRDGEAMVTQALV